MFTENSFFWTVALVGSLLFLGQLAFSFFGSHHEMESESIADIGQFQWVSRQAVVGFLMLFGWAGLTCQKEFELSGLFSSVIAFGVAFCAVVIHSLIYKGASKLKSTGTAFSVEALIGMEAITYQCVTPSSGKISVTLDNLSYEVDALSYNPEEIPSFTAVLIIKKKDDRTVFVIPKS